MRLVATWHESQIGRLSTTYIQRATPNSFTPAFQAHSPGGLGGLGVHVDGRRDPSALGPQPLPLLPPGLLQHGHTQVGRRVQLVLLEVALVQRALARRDAVGLGQELVQLLLHSPQPTGTQDSATIAHRQSTPLAKSATVCLSPLRCAYLGQEGGDVVLALVEQREVEGLVGRLEHLLRTLAVLPRPTLNHAACHAKKKPFRETQIST